MGRWLRDDGLGHDPRRSVARLWGRRRIPLKHPVSVARLAARGNKKESSADKTVDSRRTRRWFGAAQGNRVNGPTLMRGTSMQGFHTESHGD